MEDLCVFGVDIEGEDNVKAFKAMMNSSVMQDFADLLLEPARNKSAHAAMLMRDENERLIEVGRYDFMDDMLDEIRSDSQI